MGKYKYYLFSFLFAFMSVSSGLAQESLTLPYSCVFADESDLEGWTTYNQDDDPMTWQMGRADYGGSGVESKASVDFGETSNWLFSPALKLEADGRYQLSFTAYTAYSYDEFMRITIGESADPATHTQVLQEVKIPKYEGYYGFKVALLLSDIPAGNYHIGLQYYTVSPNSMCVCLNNFKVAAVSDGTILGRVSDRDGLALSDAELTLTGAVNRTITTDDQGNYRFENVPQGDYDLVAKCYGYQDSQTFSVTVEPEKNTEKDITLYAMEKGVLTGRVTDSQGNALAGASVRIKGYGEYRGVTDVAGNYTIEGILIESYSGKYEVTVLKNLFVTAMATVYIYGYGDNTKDFTLESNPIAPYEVSVQSQDGGSAVISWKRPVDMVEMKYDNGDFGGSLGFDNSHVDANILGVVYREPMNVYGVKWYMQEDSRATQLNINVIEVNDQGEPTGHVVHLEENVPFVPGKWNSVTFQEPVNCPNGFLIALSSEGHMGLGRDTNPEILGGKTQLYSNTMNSADAYTYFETVNWKGALMIRAEGERYEEGAIVSGLTYNVFRFNESDKDDEQAWNRLAQNVNAQTYTDDEFSQLASGAYHYAVSAVCSVDAKQSAKTISEVVYCRRFADVTLTVTTNSSNPMDAVGAKVTLSDGEYTYTAVVNDDNKAVFDQVWKGVYDVTVEHPGFTADARSIDVSSVAQYTDELILKQVLAPVNNIDCTLQADEASSLLQWDVYADIFDDFEGDEYKDFEINPAGRYGWQYVDKDMRVPYVFSGSTFPGMGEKSAAVLMNGTATNPPVTTNIAYSGDRELAFFACMSVLNEDVVQKFISDDYFISPELNFHKDFKLSFYARTYQSQNGIFERIRVGYSTKTDALEDFTWITEGYVTLPETYTFYEYDIPKEARYIAVNNSSTDGFMMLLDDVRLSTGIVHSEVEPSYGAVTGYKVYVDGREVATTTAEETEYLLDWNELGKGTHLVGVTKCYASGESVPLTVTVDVTTSGVTMADTDGVSVIMLDDNILSVTGSHQEVIVYSVSGRVVAEGSAGDYLLDLDHLQRDVYVVKVKAMGGRPVVSKVVVR